MAPPSGKRIKLTANIAQASIPRENPVPPQKFRYKTVARKNPQPRSGPRTRGGLTGSATTRRSSARLSSMARRTTDASSSKLPIDISQTSSSDSDSSDTSTSSSSPSPSPRNSPAPAPRSSPPPVPRQQTPTPVREPTPIPSPIPSSSPPLAPAHSPSPAPQDYIADRLRALSQGNLKVYYERGFLMNEAGAELRPIYVDPVANQWNGWVNFVDQPTVDVSVQLIHDFVANFPDEAHPTLVVVRGTYVDISAAAINGIFGFDYPLDQPDAYHTTLHDAHIPLVHSDVGRVLCRDPEAKWDTDTIHTTSMTKKAQIWAKLVRHRLIPKQHCKKLTKQVAVATYCLLTNSRFHPARLLYQALCENSKRTEGPFYLPALVKMLCDAAGVPSNEADVDMIPHPRSALDEKCLRRMCASTGRSKKVFPRAPPTTRASSSRAPPARANKGKLTALEEKVEAQGKMILDQGKLITALVQYINKTRPCCSATYEEVYPMDQFPEFPPSSMLLLKQALPLQKLQ